MRARIRRGFALLRWQACGCASPPTHWFVRAGLGDGEKGRRQVAEARHVQGLGTSLFQDGTLPYGIRNHEVGIPQCFVVMDSKTTGCVESMSLYGITGGGIWGGSCVDEYADNSNTASSLYDQVSSQHSCKYSAIQLCI